MVCRVLIALTAVALALLLAGCSHGPPGDGSPTGGDPPPDSGRPAHGRGGPYGTTSELAPASAATHLPLAE